MRIALLLQDSIVDGPGLRFVVFTQGCLHNCKGCHNLSTHDPAGGKEVAVPDIVKKMASNPLTDGLTLSGGEPFLQVADCAVLAQQAHQLGLDVWCYSGYTFEELVADSRFLQLLEHIDILIDGPFEQDLKSLNLKWRGSTNQRVLDIKTSLAAKKAVDYLL